MFKTIINRIASAAPVLFIVSLGVFLLMQLVPGDPAVTLAGGAEATPERIEEVRDELNLDAPVIQQYGNWLVDAVRGDFGESLVTGKSVRSELAFRLPTTFGLALAAGFVALLVGGTLGLLSGLNPGKNIDRFGRLVASIGVSIPSFWLGPLLVIVFAVQRRWLPPSGFVAFRESPMEWLRHIALPAVTLGMYLAAAMGRQLRAALIDVLDSNYVRTLWAKGATQRLVLVKHALRNAAIPAITVFGLQFANLIGGTVIVEQIFGIPGLGDYLLRSILASDIPVIQGATMLFVVTQVVISLLVDVSYGALNPKVRVAR
jgi:peptide/nickel transport system permease protein